MVVDQNAFCGCQSAQKGLLQVSELVISIWQIFAVAMTPRKGDNFIPLVGAVPLL